MKELKVIIPEEIYTIVEFKQDDLPGSMVINSSLLDFEPKEVFSWNLSIMLHFNEILDNGMPSKNEIESIKTFEEHLDDNLKFDKIKPNALFFASITWNGTREIIYRIFEPETANQYLQDILSKKKYPRPFDYRIDPDVEWKLNEWHLNAIK